MIGVQGNSSPKKDRKGTQKVKEAGTESNHKFDKAGLVCLVSAWGTFGQLYRPLLCAVCHLHRHLEAGEETNSPYVSQL